MEPRSDEALARAKKSGGCANLKDHSLFRTPTAQLAVNGGSQHPDKRKAGGHGPTLADEVEHLLPTPGVAGGGKKIPDDAKWSGKAAYKPDGTKVQVHLDRIEHLLPTPAVNDMGEGKTVDGWDEWTDKMKAAHGNGNGHGKSLAIEAQRLLPTPTSTDHKASGTVRQSDQWGDYGPAIARWEAVTGRAAPPPTETGPKGSPRLSPAFVEWMMGLRPGHVTGTGISRVAQLKALGNGVVPRQAEAAIRHLLAVDEIEAAA